jgi:hypothetical protein
MFDKIIYVIVNIICLVDHDRVFLEASNMLIAIEIYAFIYTLDFSQSMRTFVTLVQICIVDCALKEILKTYNCYKFVEAFSLILLLLFFVLNSFVFFSFSLIDYVIRLSIFINIVA